MRIPARATGQLPLKTLRLSLLGAALLVLLGSVVARGLFAILPASLDKVPEPAAEALIEAWHSGARGKIFEQARTMLVTPGGPRFIRLIDADGEQIAMIARSPWPWKRSLADPQTAELAAFLWTLLCREAKVRVTQGERLVGHIELGYLPPVLPHWLQAAGERAQSLAGVILLLWAVLQGLVWLAVRRPIGGALQSARPQRDGRTTDGPVPLELEPTQLSRSLMPAIDGLAQGVIMVDLKRRVRYLNRTAEQLLGWHKQEATGKAFHAICRLSDESGEAVRGPVEDCLADDKTSAFADLWLTTRGDSRRVPVQIAAVRLPEASGSQGIVVWIHDVSAWAQRAQDLRSLADTLRHMVDGLPYGVLLLNDAGRIEAANVHVARLFGYTRKEMIGLGIDALLPVPFGSAPVAHLSAFVPDSRPEDVVGRRADNSAFPVALSASQIRHEGQVGYVLSLRDRSAQARETLPERIGRILDSAAEEILLLDARRLLVLEANRSAKEKLGYSSAELRRLTLHDLAPDLDPEELETGLAGLRADRQQQVLIRTRFVAREGGEYPVELRLSLSPDAEQPVYVALARDISEQEEHEQALSFRARHDGLTGLPNRIELEVQLEAAVERAKRSGFSIVLAFIDLDGFKAINDDYGHDAGDELLREVAQRLRAAVRGSDLVARVGGDEFVAVFERVVELQDLTAVFEKIIHDVQQPVTVAAGEVAVGASIGAAAYPKDAAAPDDLVHRADQAMYRAKRSGKGRHCFYDPDADTEGGDDRLSTVERAIGKDNLDLRYLPAVRTDDLRTTAALAVVPTLPGTAVSDLGELTLVAQKTGQLGQLERQVWQSAFAQAARWRASGGKALPLWLPAGPWLWLSRTSAWLGELIDTHGMPQGGVVAMVPSRVVMGGRVSVSAQYLSALRSRAVSVAITEFASGPVDLGALVDLPLAFVAPDPGVVGPQAGGRGPELGKAALALIEAAGLPWAALDVAEPQMIKPLAACGCAWLCGPAVGEPHDGRMVFQRFLKR